MTRQTAIANQTIKSRLLLSLYLILELVGKQAMHALSLSNQSILSRVLSHSVQFIQPDVQSD